MRTPAQAHAEAERALLRTEAERDRAYRERAALVAFLAACYPSKTVAEGDVPGWSIVYVDAPTGQMSWHIAAADMDLFAHVPQGGEDGGIWDGHTTDEKYKRLAELTSILAQVGQVPVRYVIGSEGQ